MSTGFMFCRKNGKQSDVGDTRSLGGFLIFSESDHSHGTFSLSFKQSPVSYIEETYSKNHSSKESRIKSSPLKTTGGIRSADFGTREWWPYVGFLLPTLVGIL